MEWKRTDIQVELDRRRVRSKDSSPQLIPSVDNPVIRTARNGMDFDRLETERIYHEDTIRKICIDYRLRFLDVKYFKGAYPPELKGIVDELERTHSTRLEDLRIMAPSKLFKLEDKDDPLLFAPLGNGYYYLIHKWGNDLHPLRKLLMWPFRGLGEITFTVFLLSVLATLMVPRGLFSESASGIEFMMILFFMFKCVASVVIFGGFALGKNFNPVIWNSRYFNA